MLDSNVVNALERAPVCPERLAEPEAGLLLACEGGDSAGYPSFWTTASELTGAGGHGAIAEEPFG